MVNNVSGQRTTTLRNFKASRGSIVSLLSLFVIITLVAPGYLPYLPALPVSGQTDPPPYVGSWIISDNTVSKDQDIYLTLGGIVINPGGSLTLDNTIVQVTSNIEVKAGGSLYITNGSYVGTPALGLTYTILTAEPGAKVRITDSTVNGFGAIPLGSNDVQIDRSEFTMTQGAEGIMNLGGEIIIRNTTVYSAHNGIVNHQGKMWVYDSHTEDNFVGLKLYPYCTANWGPEAWLPWTPGWFVSAPKIAGTQLPIYCGVGRDVVAVNNDVTWNSWVGVHISESNVTMHNNRITITTGGGITIEDMNSNVLIYDNELIDNWNGFRFTWMPSPAGPNGFRSRINLLNNNISKCRMYASVIADNANPDITWQYSAPGYITDSDFLNRETIEVISGGDLTIRNSTFYMYPLSGRPTGFIVKDGGNLVLQNIYSEYIGKTGRAFYIQVLDGGSAQFFNSSFKELGYTWGTNGETANIYSAGDLLIENSTITDSPYGVVTNGGTTVLNYVIFRNTTDAIRGEDGTVEVFNSAMTAIPGMDIKVDGATVNIYNTSFNIKAYTVSSGSLNVYRYCDLLSTWENGAPISNVTYRITELNGQEVKNGTTGRTGLTERFYLREYRDIGAGKDLTTPHTISGKVLGMSNTTTANVVENMRIPLFLPDHVLPWLNVTYPGFDVFQRNNTLVVNGSAGDNESGLDRIQWSLDQDLWLDAEGLDNWNFTLMLAFGTYSLYVRVLDRAGNVFGRTIKVTIDKDPPFLHVLSPHDGDVTKLRTILVEGATEYGANVTIKSESVVAVDGTFRLSVPIDEGENILLVTARDSTGNSNSTTVTVYRDTTPPQISITFPPENYVTNKPAEKNLPIYGVTEPGAKLMIQGRLIPLSDNGSFYFTYGLIEGFNQIDMLAEDIMGNQNTTLRKVLYDISPPNLTIISPISGFATNKTSVKVNGLSEGSANISAKSLNASALAQADPEGRFEFEIALTEGQNIIQVTARDRAGNIKQLPVTVFRDTIAPELTLTNIKDKMVTDQTSIIAEGQTEVGARVKVNGDMVPVGLTGKFGLTLMLFSPNNTFVFEAIDKAGNSKVVTIHIKRKPVEEPKPTTPGAGMDVLMWVVILAIIIIVVQWALVARNGQMKAKKKFMEQNTSTIQEEEPQDKPPEGKGQTKRIEPRRTRSRAPEIVVEQGDQEFDIEYGDGASRRPGGGKR